MGLLVLGLAILCLTPGLKTGFYVTWQPHTYLIDAKVILFCLMVLLGKAVLYSAQKPETPVVQERL